MCRKMSPLQNLENAISAALPSTLVGLPHIRSKVENTLRIEIWKREDQFVELFWCASEKNGALGVFIDGLKAAPSLQGRGIATILLQPIVAAVQSTKDPALKIELNAYTGFSFYFSPSANGGYTWAKLGFDVKDEFDGTRTEVLERMKNSLQKRVQSVVLDCWNDSLTIDLQQKVAAYIAQAKYPWEIAEITVDDLPVGKMLMSREDAAWYYGALYPNQPDSPGMIQYAKRVDQLVRKTLR